MFATDIQVSVNSFFGTKVFIGQLSDRKEKKGKTNKTRGEVNVGTLQLTTLATRCFYNWDQSQQPLVSKPLECKRPMNGNPYISSFSIYCNK